MLFKSIASIAIRFPDLDSNHREADQMIPMHSVYAGSSPANTICVVSDDSDIYLSLLTVSYLMPTTVYFDQGKASNKDHNTYHNVKPLANELGMRYVAFYLVSMH